ncbi:MAG TPA: TlpA disulfide reductase family protein [Flavobacterium sp.]|jgi:thiol-disulfide isomerase/thioredoxin
MRLILPFCIFLLSCSFSYGQDDIIYFADALKKHLKPYYIKSEKQLRHGDYIQADVTFDSLVEHHLVGSRFTDYTLKNVNGGRVKLSKIKKPVLLLTYASWCVMGKGEIPAINKLSKKYSKDVQIVVIFWDKKHRVKKLARKFRGNVKVCYASESYKNDSRIVATLKHTLGLPTSFMLDADLDVVDIHRGGLSTDRNLTYIQSLNNAYENLESRLTKKLLKPQFTHTQLADTD